MYPIRYNSIGSASKSVRALWPDHAVTEAGRVFDRGRARMNKECSLEHIDRLK
jgi:hypothetical protein